VRIGPNHLSMTSCEAVDSIYSHGAKFNKSAFYQSFQVYAKHPSLFSDIDPKSHADRRRAVSAAYSMTSLVGLEKYIDPLIDSLMIQLRKRVKSGTYDEKTSKTSLDMSAWAHYFAMDAVGELAFGQSFGFVQKGSDQDGFLTGVSNLSHWGSMAGWIPTLSRPLRSLLKVLSGEPSGAVIDSVTKPLIDARYESLSHPSSEVLDQDDEPRMDLLAKFIKSKDPRTSKILTPQQVLTTAISVVGAGSDTTSVALTAILGYLVRHPDIYSAVQEEVDEAFETGQLIRPVTYAMGTKLLLTQACIKETLRLHPPISMSLPRIVPAGGTIIDNRFLAAGTEVSVSPYVFHRTKQAYGDDARQYKPHRWLNVSDDQRRLLEKHNLTFGGGSRQCIGKNISLMELSKVLPTLLRTFSFSITSSSQSRDNGLRRDCDGSWTRNAPWSCDSTWFLDAKVSTTSGPRKQKTDADPFRISFLKYRREMSMMKSNLYDIDFLLDSMYTVFMLMKLKIT
jgi:cytochrome P450